jgi:hypothetical protein
MRCRFKRLAHLLAPNVWLTAMSDDVIELTYEGNPGFAGFFAYLLREEGLTVNYQRPERPDPGVERRDATGTVLAVAAVVFAITGPAQSWPAIWNAVKKLKATRLGQRAKITGPP